MFKDTKETIKKAILNLLHPKSRMRDQKSGNILIFPASNFGSLGDLAMVEGLHNLINADRSKKIHIATYGPSDIWKTSFPITSTIPRPEGFVSWLRWKKTARSFDHIYLNGADVLDGKYSVRNSLLRLNAIRYASDSGVPCTITGFSFNSNPDKSIIDAFNSLRDEVRICLRDPASATRFRTRTNKKAVEVADLAFLVKPATVNEDDQDLRAINKLKSHSKKLIAFTPNIHSITTTETDQNKRSQSTAFFTETAKCLLQEIPDTSFLLLPHDIRGGLDDLALSKDIKRALEELNISHHLVADPSTPSYIKTLLQEVDLLITGRMHCGIASLGVATPAIFLDYQDKVKGLEHLFDSHFSIKLDDHPKTMGQEAATIALEWLARLPQIKQKINKRLSQVKRLSSLNSAENSHS